MKSYIYSKSAILFFTVAVLLAVSINGISQTNNGANASTVSEKTVRVGLAGVKTGSVGEGVNPQELSGAVQSLLSEYLKGTKVELVPLESKLAASMAAEAREKQCDYILSAQISHKKGGGGFGMFKAIAPVLGSVIPMAGLAVGIAGSVAGSVASTAINTAASASTNVKAKDEITLDIAVNSMNGGTQVLAKQYKAKAKSGGEDLISPMIEQAAQTILDTVGR